MVLLKYIDGWLQYKEKQGKYSRLWCVLKGNVSESGQLVLACLYCFKDQNTHVAEHLIGYTDIIIPQDTVFLIKKEGMKPSKCDFTIVISKKKFQFRADDDMARKRWIFALCELVGRHLPPQDLPNEFNPEPSVNYDASFLRWKFSRHSVTVDVASIQRRSDYITNSPKFAARYHHHSLLPNSESLPNVFWYYSNMSRVQAENILYTQPVGTYLLRNCESYLGNYTLTYRDHDKMTNHRIDAIGCGEFKFVDPVLDAIFSSPEEAVEVYMNMKNNFGLTTTPYIGGDSRGTTSKSVIPPPRRSFSLEKSKSIDKSPQLIRSMSRGYENNCLPPLPYPNSEVSGSSFTASGDSTDHNYLTDKELEAPSTEKRESSKASQNDPVPSLPSPRSPLKSPSYLSKCPCTKKSSSSVFPFKEQSRAPPPPPLSPRSTVHKPSSPSSVSIEDDDTYLQPVDLDAAVSRTNRKSSFTPIPVLPRASNNQANGFGQPALRHVSYVNTPEQYQSMVDESLLVDDRAKGIINTPMDKPPPLPPRTFKPGRIR